MEKIPTAKAFLSDNIDRSYFPFIDEDIEDGKEELETVLDVMKEFAALHVKAALEAAANNVVAYYHDEEGNELNADVSESSITEAYPLNNIQ